MLGTEKSQAKIEHHSCHAIHGIPLRFHSNHPVLAEHAEFFLRYFPETVSNGAKPIVISFLAMDHWDDFPIDVPSSIFGPHGQEKLQKIEVPPKNGRQKFYLDSETLVYEIPAKGIRAIIQESQGIARAYFVRPELLKPEYQMRFLQSVISRILKLRGYFTLHATALEKNGRAILIPGNSGRGKTTAFISLLRSGYRCLSDDHPLVRENGNGLEILPFLEKVDVTEGTIRHFPELQTANSLLYPGLRKRFFLVEEIYPHGTGSASKPGLILFPEIINDSQSVLDPVSGNYAFDRLIREAKWTRGRGAAKQEFQILSRLVAQSSCYRLLFGQDILALPDLIDPLMVAR